MKQKRSKEPKVSKRKNIRKIKAEINEMKTIKRMKKINDLVQSSWVFEKINKIDKNFIGLTNKKRKNKPLINKIRNRDFLGGPVVEILISCAEDMG